ncbi:unnamed protein product [Spodoptera exigua]|nr:unnamed protein product [Spodoptera exigua]
MTATPNCSLLAPIRINGVHVFVRGSYISILLAPLYPSMPPIAKRRPIVDVRGRVLCENRRDLRSGNRCHFTASMMRGWHSGTLPQACSTLSIRYSDERRGSLINFSKVAKWHSLVALSC